MPYLVQRQVGGDDQRFLAAVSAVYDVVDLLQRILCTTFHSEIVNDEQWIAAKPVYNCMKTPRMIHAIHRQSYGVTDFRLRLYWDSFTPITCQLPTLPEQQKIAAILSTQDKVIELKEKLLVQKQQQKKYLMQQLLTGKKRLPGFDRKWNYVKANEIFKSIVDKSHDGKLEVLSSTQDKGIVPRSQVDIDIKYNENSLSTYKKVCEGDFVIWLFLCGTAQCETSLWGFNRQSGIRTTDAKPAGRTPFSRGAEANH